MDHILKQQEKQEKQEKQQEQLWKQQLKKEALDVRRQFRIPDWYFTRASFQRYKVQIQQEIPSDNSVTSQAASYDSQEGASSRPSPAQRR